MINRKATYESLRKKMEEAGFLFEREQKPHRQNRKELELVFIHPELINKFEKDGFKVNAHKFYIKPLSDELDCEIGLVTGISSPLYKLAEFIKPNTIDSNRDTPAWTNRQNDSVLDKLLSQIKLYTNSFSKTSDKNIRAFLFTWNPQKWNWTDIQEDIEHLQNNEYLMKRWSCGNSKNIRKGDRIFLLKLGQEPKGIMGSGYAKSSTYVGTHWDGTVGKNANYVDIEFDVLINPERSTIFEDNAFIKVDPNRTQQWFPQQSGISINPEIVSSLESNWFDFIRENKYFGNYFVSNDEISEGSIYFIEGKAKEITQTRYERNPYARKTCLMHYGYSCQICDFNFEKYFGEIGKGFIHVHHINSISSIGKEYQIDPINDLIPVCPNCHAMIHSKIPAYTPQDIKEFRLKNMNHEIKKNNVLG